METKIEGLTNKQDGMIEKIASEYEKNALSCDDNYDVESIMDGIDFIYKLADLKPPEIVICASPLDMIEQAKIKKGETFDNIGCGYDSGWTAFYDFMERIGVKYDPEWEFDKWKNFITKSGVFATVLCENVAFVCIRPCVVNRNTNYDLHCEDGPAIAWRDGYGDFYLNGVAVDEKIVMTPAEKIDAKTILSEKNAEVRREIVRKIGIDIVCQRLGAKIMDSLDDYELLNLDMGDERKRPYLKMLNPSIGVYHVEGVHPDCLTVKQALEWRNGTKEIPIVLT